MTQPVLILSKIVNMKLIDVFLIFLKFFDKYLIVIITFKCLSFQFLYQAYNLITKCILYQIITVFKISIKKF
jgi:hypothetical protein